MANGSREKLMLSSPRNEVQKKLEEQIREGEQILTAPIKDERDFKLAKEANESWYDYTKDLLSSLFNTDDIRQEFVQTVSSWGLHLSFQEQVHEFREHLDRRLNKLRSIVRRLELFKEDIQTDIVPQVEETKSVSTKTVFVVHGRDESLRKSMFDFLRSIDLNPLEWSQAIVATKKPSPYIGDILNTAFRLAQAIVVISSGDDEARLLNKFIKDIDPDYERELTPQPRPNVLFEAGMAMGRSQERTILVQVGKVKPWSDIAGRHITYLDNSPEKRNELVNKLKAAGCDVDTSGEDWYKTGDFGSDTDIDITKNNGTSTRRKGSSKSREKQLIKKQLDDLYARVLETLNKNDATLEHDYRVEYVKLLQSAIAIWLTDKDKAVFNQLLLLKAEAGTFDINRILSKDKLGSIKWVLNSIKKMCLIIESDD